MLITFLFRDTNKVTEWNKTLTEAKVLKTINSEVAITYQVKQSFLHYSLYLNFESFLL